MNHISGIQKGQMNKDSKISYSCNLHFLSAVFLLVGTRSDRPRCLHRVRRQKVRALYNRMTI